MHTPFRRSMVAVHLPLLLVMLCGAPTDTRGDDGLGAIDGAIWRFSLTPQFPKNRGNAEAEMVRGAFRVQNFEMFQAEDPEDRKNLNKKVGTSKPFGKGKRPTHTIVDVSELRVWDKSRKMTKIAGTGRLTRDENGVGSGLFVSKDGTRWDMKITRFKE